MTTPNTDRPELVDQDMTPHGVWRAGINSLTWEPADGDYTILPVGPILPQEHDEGMWAPQAGALMVWIPAPVDVPVTAIAIVNVPGDEDQADAPVIDEIEQAES